MRHLLSLFLIVTLFTGTVSARNLLLNMEQDIGKTRSQIEKDYGPPSSYFRGVMNYVYPNTTEAMNYTIVDGKVLTVRYVKFLKEDDIDQALGEAVMHLSRAGYETFSEKAFKKGDFLAEWNLKYIGEGVYSFSINVTIL